MTVDGTDLAVPEVVTRAVRGAADTLAPLRPDAARVRVRARRNSRRRRVALCAGLAVAVLAAGITVTRMTGTDRTQRGTAAPTGSTGALGIQPHWESCAAARAGQYWATQDSGGLAMMQPRLDPGFRPVAAVVCRTEVRRRVTGGSDLVALEDRADDVARLVATLGLPSRVGTAGTACPATAITVPWIALLDANGRWVRPGIPHDECQAPRQEFRAAFDALRMTPVATWVVREVQSDEAAAAGCDQQRLDLVWTVGRVGIGQGTPPRPVGTGDEQVRVCRYWNLLGADLGDFDTGGVLTAEQWAAIRRELGRTGPASTCTTKSSRFAELQLSTGSVYVEADGCRRVLFTGLPTGQDALRQGSAALIALVFKR